MLFIEKDNPIHVQDKQTQSLDCIEVTTDRRKYVLTQSIHLLTRCPTSKLCEKQEKYYTCSLF